MFGPKMICPGRAPRTLPRGARVTTLIPLHLISRLLCYPTSQVSIWVLGTSAFIGNLFVVVWRVRTDRSKASSFFVINLGCSDFLMGLYLLIIGSVDSYYRGVYIVHADAWRASNLCQVAGFLATLSRLVVNNNNNNNKSMYLYRAISPELYFFQRRLLQHRHVYVSLCGAR